MTRRTILLLISLVLFICNSLSSEPALQSEKIELPREAVFKKVLENGLILLVSERQGQDLVSINITIKAGLNYEGEYLGSGISHFVEHMVFKGTKIRKVGTIEKEIKSYGGFLNGSVSHDLTNFHVTVPSKYLANTLRVLKDMLLNATFDQEEFEKEKEVILKEIKLNRDEPQSELIKLLYDTAYMHHPYKHPVIGYEDKLKALKKEDLIKYYNRMYVPNRIIIAIVGGVEREDVISMIENEFEDFRPANYGIESQNLEPLQLGERRLDKGSPITLSYLAMAFHSTSILDKDLFAMDLLSMILGRGDSSRLNMSLFKEKRIVHFISSWNYTPKDPGLFVITVILDKGNLDSAEQAISSEIERSKKELIKDEELERAKRTALSDFIFSRETIEEEALDISRSEALTGNYDYSRRYVDGIQSVSKEDLRRVANEYLTDDNLTVVRLRPAGKKSEKVKSADISIAADTMKEEVLPNGLRVLFREDRKTPTISISVAISGGLSVEEKSNNGISSLTARMLLEGTSLKKEDEIKGALENRGGHISPFSGHDSFGVNITLLKGDIDLALEILKDILRNSVFPQEQLDRERTLTLAMIKDEDDDIFKKGFRLLRKNLFEGHPYGLRNIGEEESIKSLKTEDLLNFYKTYCVPNNMVISISGDIEYGSLSRKIKDIFKDMKKKEIFSSPVKEARFDRVKSQTLTMDKEESLVLMGFKTTSIKDQDRYALDVLGSILSGSSGRLFNSLRDKLSLAYTLGCVQKVGVNAGYFIFYVATTKDRIEETKDALIDEIKLIRSKTVEDEELVTAKRELSSGHKMNMQTNEFFSFQSALDELYGVGYDNIYKYEKEIEKVTREDIKHVARKYLDLEGYAEIIISSFR